MKKQTPPDNSNKSAKNQQPKVIDLKLVTQNPTINRPVADDTAAPARKPGFNPKTRSALDDIFDICESPQQRYVTDTRYRQQLESIPASLTSSPQRVSTGVSTIELQQTAKPTGTSTLSALKKLSITTDVRRSTGQQHSSENRATVRSSELDDLWDIFSPR